MRFAHSLSEAQRTGLALGFALDAAGVDELERFLRDLFAIMEDRSSAESTTGPAGTRKGRPPNCSAAGLGKRTGLLTLEPFRPKGAVQDSAFLLQFGLASSGALGRGRLTVPPDD